MPGRSKTSSTALAAVVMATAATVTSLWSSPGSAPAAGTSPVARSAHARASGEPAAVQSPAAGQPAGAVLFVGRSATLNPRGGVTKSFACQAAVSLKRSCLVRDGASPSLPPSVSADAVVVALAPSDDATRVGLLLDRLPRSLAGAPTVIMGPIAVTSDAGAVRRLADVRRLATARGAVVVDPVAQRWVTSRTAATYLAPAGGQLTAAGHRYVAGRLAAVLVALSTQ